VSKLTPDAKALVEAGRGAHRPTLADRQRVREALQARLAASGGPPVDEAPPAPPAPSGLAWAPLAGLVAAVALIGGAAWLRWDDSAPTPALLRPALSGLHAQLPSTVESAPLPPVSAPAAAARTVPSAQASPPRGGGGLAEEVALLSRAETALHAGRFGSALRVLDDYERRFPRGALAQEDVSARVQALCGLGRVADAKSQLRRLAANSPHASRARAACGAERLR
jgi:hypothetical protein